jgi:predicted Zn-dependent protease
VAGKDDIARGLLENVIESQPSFLDAHILLTDMCFRANDRKALKVCMERLQGIPRSRDFLLFLKGQLALRDNDLAAARDHFESAHTFMPRNALVLDTLLRLDVVERKSDQARRHAIALLRLDPDSAPANHVMGSFHLEARDYDRAESLLRKSLQTRRSYETLNDLAWTLQAMDRLDEAESLIREAVKMSPGRPHAHDTLGTILMKRNRPTDALAAFERYRAILPQDPLGKLHAAQALVRMNELDRARTLVEEISTQDALLTPEQQQALAELKTRL